MAEAKREVKQFSFEGEWIPALDPLKIGEQNFASLENCRYEDAGLAGVLGFSKINSSTIMDPTYFKGRAGIYLPSSYSGQPRVLVQAKNTALSAGVILENKATIPATGSFETTDVYTEAANALVGSFSGAPMGHIFFANSKETCVFGSDEVLTRAFKNYDPTGTFRYDFIDVIQNIMDDDYNVARIVGVEENWDSYAKFILNLNNNLNDDLAGCTPTGTVSYSSSIKMFGSHAADLNGTSDYIQIADDAKWDVSGGVWAFEGWIRLKELPSAGNVFYILYQGTDAANYMEFHVTSTGALRFAISATGASVVDMTTRAGVMQAGNWSHVAITESGDNWWIFHNGQQQAYVSDSSRAANYTGNLYLGYNGTVGYFKGYLDSLRFSNGVARYTDNFEPPGLGFQYNSDKTYMLIGASRPLKGFKIYVKTPNAVSGAMHVFYWDGTIFTEVSSLVDGTAGGGASLATTGNVTFSSTVGFAKPKLIDSVLLYWYKVVIEASVTSGCTISHVTVAPPFQKIIDLWDGVFRTCIKYLVRKADTYLDFTTNVAEEDYETSNTASYAQLGGMTSSEHYVLGFEEPQTGLIMTLVEGYVNSSSNIILSVYYWNGAAWTMLNDVIDGTFDNNTTHAKSGTISWTPPNFNTEFKRTISNELPLFYYKLELTGSTPLNANVFVDYLGGIPAQKNVHRAYKFPFALNDRVYLCNSIDTKEGNRVDYFERNTLEVMNGEDSSEGSAGALYFGGSEELTGAIGIYNRIGSQIYNVGVFTKKAQTYVLNGVGPEDWKYYTVSETLGCPAPETLDAAEVGFAIGGGAEEAKRNIAIWLTYSGPIIFDVAVPIPAWRKIRNFFDKSTAECVNFAKIDLSVGWFDPENSEYNLLFPSGVGQETLNKWLVLDLVRFRWYEKKPPIYPQTAFRVFDQYGNIYVYGLFDDGYMRRLEHTAAWTTTTGSSPIEHRILTADQLPTKTVWDITKVSKVKLVLGTISEAIPVSVFHYTDGETTGQTVLTTVPTGSKRHNRQDATLAGEGKGWSHQFEFKGSSATTQKGVKWLAWSYQWHYERED